ncbi:MAG TPA: hypothetical protein VEW08_05620 [Steroidobacteraceae bacterium]|nr:hypothetical protein [Steroidobacteraceae bacterium]
MEAASRIESSGVNQAPAAGGTAPGTPAPAMDREFIIKNQIVERYLAGRLPPKGVTDFERLIRSRPQLIEELGLADKVNAGLRLLDAAGIAEPWAEKEKKAWEKPAFAMGAAALAIAALIGCAVLGMQVSSRNAIIAKQKLENLERPIAPSTRKRTILVGVARNGPPAQATLSISHGEFAELKADLSWARYASYKVSIDRVDQGRVAVLDGLEKDSNGHVRISLNAGAFGPGDYMVSIEGLNMRRESIPIAWYRVAVTR